MKGRTHASPHPHNAHVPPASRPPLAAAAPEQLVSIESQQEYDLFEGRTIERLFVKLYQAARTSGLLASISDRDWKTLCTLATYMDPDGYCYPSQKELARALGCSRQMANERVRSLAAFRFQGQQVLLIVKPARTGSGRWSGNAYRVLPLASLHVGTGRSRSALPVTAPPTPPPPAAQETTVSRPLDTAAAKPAVSIRTVTVALDTNKRNRKNKTQQHRSGSRRKTAQVAQAAETPLPGSDVVDVLKARGVSPRAAKQLVGTYPLERIRQKVEIVDFLMATKSRLVGKNAPGFLRMAIIDDYFPPAEYLAARDKEARRRQHQHEHAQAEDEELRRRAEDLTTPPEQRTARWLAAWERWREAARKPPLSDQERSELVATTTERFRAEAEAFFVEHPELQPTSLATVSTPAAAQSVAGAAVAERE